MKHLTYHPFTTTAPWTLRDIVIGVITGVILLISSSLFMAWFGDSMDSAWVIILGEGSLLIPVWYFTVYKYGVSWGDLGLRRFKPTILGLGCSFMIAFVIIQLIYASLLAYFGLQTQPGLDKIFQKTDFAPLLFFGGAVVAPFVEELFFRGFIFMGLRDKMGWAGAVFISAGLFAFAHVIPTAFFPIFLLGVIFATLTEFSGSIWPAILIHTLNNTLSLSVVYLVQHYHLLDKPIP